MTIFEISLVCHLVSTVEIKFSVYKQTFKHTNTQTPYREDKSLCFTKAGATKNEKRKKKGKEREIHLVSISEISLMSYLVSIVEIPVHKQANKQPNKQTPQ